MSKIEFELKDGVKFCVYKSPFTSSDFVEYVEGLNSVVYKSKYSGTSTLGDILVEHTIDSSDWTGN